MCRHIFSLSDSTGCSFLSHKTLNYWHYLRWFLCFCFRCWSCKHIITLVYLFVVSTHLQHRHECDVTDAVISFWVILAFVLSSSTATKKRDGLTLDGFRHLLNTIDNEIKCSTARRPVQCYTEDSHQLPDGVYQEIIELVLLKN